MKKLTLLFLCFMSLNANEALLSYILLSEDAKEQKEALWQENKALELAIETNKENKEDLVNSANKVFYSVACMHQRYYPEIVQSKIEKIKELTLNTKEKQNKYEEFSMAISGMSFTLPENGCQ